MKKNKKKNINFNIPEEYQDFNNLSLINILFSEISVLKKRIAELESDSGCDTDTCSCETEIPVNDVFDWHMTNEDIRNIVIAGQITVGEMWDIRDEILKSDSKCKRLTDAELYRRIRLVLRNKKINIRSSVIRSVCAHTCASVKSELCEFKDMMSATGIELNINMIAELILYGVFCNFDKDSTVYTERLNITQNEDAEPDFDEDIPAD